MPVYNSAAYLREAVDSALNQDCSDFEVLIVDDCSTDGTAQIAAAYAAADSRVRFIANSRNLGMVANWNFCLESAVGEYVKFLFGDDILSDRTALSSMVAALDSDPAISLVAASRNLVDEQSTVTGVARGLLSVGRSDGRVLIKKSLFVQKNLIGEPSAVMFRRSQAGRGFDGRYSQFVDLEMWFYLLEQGDIYYFTENLVSFRRHSAQQTEKNIRDLVHVDEMLSLLDNYRFKPDIGFNSVIYEYLKYHQLYRFWKAYRVGLISRAVALDKISNYCEPRRFMLALPLYKVANPIWKLRSRYL